MRRAPPPVRTPIRALALAVASTTPLQAQVILGTEARVRADSNPLLLAGDRTDAVMGEVSLKPEFKTQDARGNTFDLAGVLTGRSFSRRYDDYLLGSALATGTLRDSERVSASAAAGFTRDLVADTPTIGVDALIAPASTRNTLRGTAELTWRPNARTMIVPKVAVERSTYNAGSLLRDTRSVSGEASALRLLSAQTWVGVRTLAEVSRIAGEPQLARFAVFGSLDKTMDSGWHLQAQLGGEHVDGSSRAASTAFARRPASYLSGSLRFCREGQRTDACLDAALGSEVSALAGFQRRTAAGASITHRLDDRRTLIARADYARVAAPRGAIGVPPLFASAVDAALASLQMEWRVRETATLAGEIGYARRAISGGDAPSSAYAGLTLRWQPRLR